MMWIYPVFVLLLSEVECMKGTNQSTPVSNATRRYDVFVIKHLNFNSGSDVNLTCSDKPWNEIIFIIWKIHLKDKDCTIGLASDGLGQDSCNDGKALRNTSLSQSYLHIPKVSYDDEGVYKCELIYKGGTENYDINLAITAPPSVSAWLEHKNDKMVAVCKAERGKPAANISWSHGGNWSLETRQDSNGFFTVESRLELLEGEETENLSCVIRHPYWREERILTPTQRQQTNKDYLLWLGIPSAVVVVVFLAGFLFFVQKKLVTRRHQQSDTSTSKSAPTEDVEEVEPYASYVQRVNSIYNSSADLFT